MCQDKYVLQIIISVLHVFEIVVFMAVRNLYCDLPVNDDVQPAVCLSSGS
jgi:hypothetical protein